MTLNELSNLLIANLTRIGSNRVTAPEILQSCQAIVSYFATQIANIIPDWTNALNFNMDGTGAGAYCKYPDDDGVKRLFESKTNGNTNHAPPGDPTVHENTYWKEVSASESAAIPEWSVGIYGPGLIIVFHNHSVDGRGLYVLLEPTRPYNSTNIEAEITAGDWELISGSGGGAVWGAITGTLTDQTDLVAALAGKENTTNKGVAGGYAGLDGSGKVPSSQLPAYVDDVVEYANLAALPGTGVAGIIYITIDTNYEYRWSGSAYIRLVASPGSSDAVPEGSTNLYFTEARVRASVLTGLSLITNAAITASDSVLSAFGKIQKQITDLINAKDSSGGYAGLTLFKINFKNVANTFTSFFTNANTAARTYTFQDRNGTIADDTDLALKAPLASPALTGTPTAPTASASTNTTQLATTAFVIRATVNTNLFMYYNFY